jgi:glucose/arabinose dehydrogenase
VFAPNGDLFAAAPSNGTPGGSSGGPGQILVISDDDHDGVGESHVFATGLPDVHGLALGGGYLYFTNSITVFRTPYVVGQRQESGPREDLSMPATFGNGRWTHGLARSVGGSLLASSGEYSSCGIAPTGSISQVSLGGTAIVAAGFRNPMYLRCHYKDELCATNELGEDQTTGAREKFIVIRPDTNYGYPCCLGAQEPRASGDDAACATVTREDAEFTLSETPFGFDWEHDTWPSPYTGGVFVALHGSAYSSPQWAGAKIVFAPADAKTHLPAKDAWQEFVGGFGPDGGPLQRPADVTFAPDGRLFFADDLGGQVYWVAPDTLTRPD